MSDLVSLQDHPEFAQLQRALVTHPETSTAPVRAAEKPDISKVLGEKLQSGWCLRAEHCPLCHAPLMSKGNDMFCFGCNLPVRREEDLPANYTLNKPAAASNDKPKEDHAHATDNPLSTSVKSDEKKSSKKDSEKVDELPELEDLPGLPEKELMLDEDGDFEFDAEAFARARKKSDEVSEKIGKYMLMGWTLMDVHCSTDFCPLMRSADRKTMLCLSCGTEYEEEGEDEDDVVKITTASSSTQKESSVNKPSATPSSAPLSAAQAPSSAPRSSASSSSSSSSASPTDTFFSSSPSFAPSAFRNLPPASTSPLPSSLDPHSASAELLQLEQVLVAKLAWLRGLMAETQDISECCRYADAIRALLGTLAALYALRK